MTEAQEGVKQKNPWHRPVILLIAFLMVIGIVALVAIAVVQNKQLPQKLKYGIVLDAGSSHTALYIYQWPAEKQNDTGKVQQLEACKVEGPGISSYSKEVTKAGLALNQCLDKAKEIIPEHQHTETPLYLGATAGMRLLRLQDEQQSQRLLNSVEKFIRLYPFNFQGARIIRGQEEGGYGWITINYLLGNFLKDSGWITQLSGGKDTETFGALDLGGASTQITFVPEGDVEPEESTLYFRLYGTSYTVYTHSFLCYGKDQALKLLLAQRKESVSGTITSPCFNKEYTRNLNVTAFYNTPCILGLPNTTQDIIKVIGEGNAEECRKHVRALFSSTDYTLTSCPFNCVYQPQVQGEFVAFSAFYFVMNFLNLTGKEPLKQMKDTIDNFCARSWNEVKDNFPKTRVKYLSEYCFSANYILILLTEGYNFTSDNLNKIQFMRKIKGNDAGWTLGYMLNLTNMIPAELPSPRSLTHTSYVTLMVIFSLFLLILLLLTLLNSRGLLCRAQKGI
ncbi:ectonucleoside triphosphate diphosphohydrolase 1 [Callorhinchus milii]|uniref:Ectonucleoside triphosphate diphosphohydrolase 1 n=1 Tax=Callorhinchus milii TaxID=7868 RepID=A0A4W3IJX9_CALMI|nr:ectonucleoside triphosphate diphosphohydrolase 1 [Callorhinchus milii]|eukprot:gi/632983662/ref/XP_007908757.1/ PREDICTED: ectonucleoside triphosphate diphosphohydrolase 1 [Callorhinchus milii]